jgi:hypothetical protein
MRRSTLSRGKRRPLAKPPGLEELEPRTLLSSGLNIPDFGAQPTIYSVKSGSWSDRSVWSGNRLPHAGDIVDIKPGTTVTYDRNDATDSVPYNTVEVQGNATLTFRTDINTQICVGNFLVLSGGSLVVGTTANPIAASVHANIHIANQPINTTLDPEQYGTGLIVLGNVTMHGTTKTPYVALSQEAHAEGTVLHLASPVTGWQAGDDILLPDTRQLFESFNTGTSYNPQWESAVSTGLKIASVSPDGKTITLNEALRYDHLGARDHNGVLNYLPQVANLQRNVMIESQSMTGTRGYTLFTGNANVNIQDVGFCELGRTVNGLEDNTTFNPDGSVAHVGTNEGDRYPMTVLNLIGPRTAQSNGYQFTLINNVVDNDGDGNPNNPKNIMWGLALSNSFYGLIQGNDVWSVSGTGIGVEDGASSFNRFDSNFVANVTGTGGRLDDQLAGDGYWFHNPNNYVTNNIATDINAGSTGDIYDYGFSVDAVTNDAGGGQVGNQLVPAFQGADPSVNGVSVNMNAIPLLLFSGNEVYGATARGFSTWWLGTIFETPDGNAGTMKNSVVWNQFEAAYFAYETNNLVIDGFTVRGDASQQDNPYLGSYGIVFGDYMTRNAVVKNVDIQNEAVGVFVPVHVGRYTTPGTFTLQNSYLDNNTNVEIPPLMSNNFADGLVSRTVIIQNVQFVTPANLTQVTPYDIQMDVYTGVEYDPAYYPVQANIASSVYVYNFNNVAGDNFQVYRNDIHPANATQVSDIYGYVKAI